MTLSKDIFTLNGVPQDFFQPNCHRGTPEVGRGAASFCGLGNVMFSLYDKFNSNSEKKID